MKKAFLILALMAVCMPCFAQCTGTPVSIKKGSEFIYVEVYYSLNGVQYGTPDIISYNPSIFFGMTKADVLSLVTEKIDLTCDRIIRANYKKVNGQQPEEEAEELAVDAILPQLQLIKDDVLQIEVSKNEYTQQFDTDGDNENDQTWTIKADGSKSVSNITP